MNRGDSGPVGGRAAVARRRLGIALRELREESGITGEDAAQALTRHASWISRLESGRVGIRLPDLHVLFDLYHLNDDERRRSLEALAIDSIRRGRGWWSRYAKSIPAAYATYVRLEDQARSLSIYEDRVIPGLLQTTDYGRAIFDAALPPVDKKVADERIKIRQERQRILDRDDAPTLKVIINESGLRRTFGRPDVHRAQLAYLLDKMPRAHPRILPLTHAALILPHSFTILDFEEDPSLVHVESPVGGSLIGGEEVNEYIRLFDHLGSAAANEAESRTIIRTVMTANTEGD
jgi:transcriptional regulator with XRE-family HTH domain